MFENSEELDRFLNKVKDENTEEVALICARMYIALELGLIDAEQLIITLGALALAVKQLYEKSSSFGLN